MKMRRGTGALLGAFFILILSACGKSEEPQVDLSAFQPPAGYEWEGSYIDEGGTTTLTIEKQGKKYNCVINTMDADVTHIDTYEFTATLDDTGLTYENGVHTSFDLPDFEADPDATVSSTEIYTDGTGSIYYLDDHLYWLDNVRDAGNGYAFLKTEEEEE